MKRKQMIATIAKELIKWHDKEENKVIKNFNIEYLDDFANAILNAVEEKGMLIPKIHHYTSRGEFIMSTHEWEPENE